MGNQLRGVKTNFAIFEKLNYEQILCLYRTIAFVVKSVNAALSGQRDEFDLPLISRFEAHGRACGDVEPEAARGFPIKPQRRINLVKVEMAADLHGPVARVGDDERASC